MGKRVLFTGAGAEVDLGFASGCDFTNDTFYRKKSRLYNALETFYQNRLSRNEKSSLPDSYYSSFLFNSRGRAFKLLVDNLIHVKPDAVAEVLGKSKSSIQDVSALEGSDLEKLFELLIIENDSSDDKLRQKALLREYESNQIHFGILESYYFDLLHPRDHPQRFWKLINFYWSAFFSILLPITDCLYKDVLDYEKDRYAFVLTHLDEVIKRVNNPSSFDRLIKSNTYYAKLKTKFDYVITTNYTPYVTALVSNQHSEVARLAGCLSWFERLDTLEFDRYEDEDAFISEDTLIFPYLMCQSPVKPIISTNQINEFSKAVGFLKEADEIVILGYSFCDEDAHIASMVSSAIRNNPNMRIVYLDYTPVGETTDKLNKRKNALGSQLRLSKSEIDRIEIRGVYNCESEAFLELVG